MQSLGQDVKHRTILMKQTVKETKDEKLSN